MYLSIYWLLTNYILRITFDEIDNYALKFKFAVIIALEMNFIPRIIDTLYLDDYIAILKMKNS